MRRVLYLATSLSHKRVFESFTERADMIQLVVGPPPIIGEGIVPEDYSDFKIKKIKFYNNIKHLQSIIDKFNPNIFVQASLPCAKGLSLPSGCKKAYVSHGVVGNQALENIKKEKFNLSVWQNCDVYFGAGKSFKPWIDKVVSGNNRVVLDSVPQFDLLADESYVSSYKDRILNKISPTVKFNKIILFFGFCCKDRVDFKQNNEDYFATVIELERVAREHGWLIMVKPRHTNDKMLKFLKTHKWGKKYIEKYKSIIKSKNIHFITTTGHIYRYFFADMIIANGFSTVELEACYLNKPLFIVRTKYQHDPFDTVRSSAATLISSIDDIYGVITNSNSYHNINGQDKLLLDSNISKDGRAHERVQNVLLKI